MPIVSHNSKVVTYQDINPTKYVLRVNSDGPFFLMFSESYNRYWKAYIGEEEINSIPAYSFINGFYINKTGEFDIVVEFIGQAYFRYGIIISLVSFILITSFAFLNWRRYWPFKDHDF